MHEFFSAQIDYIFFTYGLAFIILAAISVLLRLTGNRYLPWGWLGGFGLIHGLNEWADMLASMLGGSPGSYSLRTLLLVLSFLFLLEFARRGIAARRGKGSLIWIYLPLFFLVGILGFTGELEAVRAVSRYTTGLIGGLASAWLFFTSSREIEPAPRRWLISGSIAIGLYGIFAGLICSKSSLCPTLLINQELFFQTLGIPVQLVRGGLAVWLALSILMYSQLHRVTPTLTFTSLKRSYYTVLAAVTMFVVITTGWVATEVAANYARQEVNDNSKAIINLLNGELTQKLQKTGEAVVIMAGSPLIKGAFLSGTSDSLEAANAVLDRYNAGLKTSVSYLMDADGTTIASSNRNSKKSFVGKNYGFRPYFKEAISGRPGSYFALGVTSGKRGYYASSPVRDGAGRIIGAVIIKNTIDDVEKNFAFYKHAFFIDPNGIIFLSGIKELLFRSMWPLGEEVRKRLTASKQFGYGPFEPLIHTKPFGLREVELGEKRYLLNSMPVGTTGWSILLFSPTAQITFYRLLCIMVTASVCFLTIVYFIALQRGVESAERVAEGEEIFRAVFETARDSIFIKDRDLKYIRMNPAMKTFINKPEGEIIGKTDIELLGEAEGKKAMGQERRALKGEVVADEPVISVGGEQRFFHSVKVPLYDVSGEIVGICGFARDITERKEAEEKIESSLQEKEVLLREIHHRVKNNMQIISSLLKLQSGYIRDELYADMLKDSQNRIKTMALVHEKLYRSKEFSRIDTGDYIRNLTKSITRSYAIDTSRISVTVDCNDFSFGIDTAIPCGLVINELISNSLKHGFPDGREGEVRVSIRSLENGTFELVVTDNGVGMPEEIDFRNTETLGLQLVTTLSENQLGGRIELKREGGTEFRIRFSEVRHQERTEDIV